MKHLCLGVALLAMSTALRAQDSRDAQSPAEPTAPDAPLELIPVQPLPPPDDEAPRQLEEMVVTAQKTEQTLQEVPVSVTAIDGGFIQSTGSADLADVSLYVPNVRVDADDLGSPQVFIRGFGTNAFNPSFESSVGFVQDEIVFGRPGYFTEAMFDIDSVEVLRGPQGTLFGKNTVAGVFNVMTKDAVSGAGADGRIFYGEHGEHRVEAGLALTIPYDDAFRTRLRAAIQGTGDMDAVEVEITDLHRDAVRVLMERAGLSADQVDIVGFHGHTVLHEPEVGRTRQIGLSQRLADHLGIDVVGDLRLADMAAGGQGAPVAPVFHRALAGPEGRPVVVLNMGGVANVTWLGPGEADLLGFDTGPGNAPIDDWCWRMVGRMYDADGALAKAGTVDQARLARMLADPYFDRKPPKSLDRDAFHERVAEAVDGLSPEDGAATLVAFSAETIAGSARWFPAPPTRWIATGGGRHNPALMAAIAEAVQGEVVDADALGWDGDALEAQAFAYLAVRSILGLDITFPGTTGVAEPRTGGKRYFSSVSAAGTLASR